MVRLLRLLLRLLLLLPLCAGAGAAAATAAAAWPDCSSARDGHFPHNGTRGPYASVLRVNASYLGSPLFALYPEAGPEAPLPGKTPLVVFMHGTAAKAEMYLPNLYNYASHGFTVVFPYIKSPEADCCRRPIPPTNTNGKFILQGLAWARNATADAASPLFGRVDLSSVVVAGHSMGATCSIMAGTRLAVANGVIDAAAVKLVSTQHPGVCGPFGPPPWPSTWMPSDLQRVSQSFPMLFTTATNDGAFWPAPMTAPHERGCFTKALGGAAAKNVDATYVEFATSACLQDGGRAPFDDSGHNCPFKTGVETPWVLTWMKHYAQQGGKSAACKAMMASVGKGFGVNATIRYTA